MVHRNAKRIIAFLTGIALYAVGYRSGWADREQTEEPERWQDLPRQKP